MPRRSSAALAIPPLPVASRSQLSAPGHLPADVGALWLHLAAGAPGGHFGRCDLVLLETLAVCLVRLRALHAGVAVGDTGALDELQRLALVAGTLASKLRLSASASSRIDTARPANPRPGIEVLFNRETP